MTGFALFIKIVATLLLVLAIFGQYLIATKKKEMESFPFTMIGNAFFIWAIWI